MKTAKIVIITVLAIALLLFIWWAFMRKSSEKSAPGKQVQPIVPAATPVVSMEIPQSSTPQDLTVNSNQ